ncbi:MAG: rRNA maturation RNase YbeY [Phycisphaerales bacterium]
MTKVTQTLTSCPSATAAPGDQAEVGETSADTDPDQPAPGNSPESPSGRRITLDLQTPDCDPPTAGWLEPQLARIVALAGVERCELNLAVVDDEQMSELHGQYLGIAGTTDVLTFDLRDDPDQPVEGDIVICIDEARRQAKDRGHDTRLELLLYAVHGLLHLLGEDDHDPADYEKMHKREDDLLTRAGLGAVFGIED